MAFDFLKDLIVVIGGDNTDLANSLEDSTRRVSRWGQQMGQVGAAMTQLGGRLTTAITVPLAGVAAASIELSSKLESNVIAFTQLLGSADAAREHIIQLRDFALKTPFQFVDLVDSTRQLLALGFAAKDVIPTMRVVGDTVAALGGGKDRIEQITYALGKMQATGVINSREMFQLAMAGVPAWAILAKTLNVDVAQAMQLVTKRAVDSATAVPAFIAALGERFGGLMEKQMMTVLGQWSNLKDKLQFVLTDIGTQLKPLTLSLIDFATKGVDKLKELAEEFGHLSIGEQQAALGFTAFAAAAGPSLIILGQIASSIANITTLITKLAPYAKTGLGFLTDAAPYLAVAAAIAYGGSKLLEYGAHVDVDTASTKKLEQSFKDITATHGNLPYVKTDVIGGLLSYAKGLQATDNAAKAYAPTIQELSKAMNELNIKGIAEETTKLNAAFQLLKTYGKLSADELSAAYGNLQLLLKKVVDDVGDMPLAVLGVSKVTDAHLQTLAEALRQVHEQFLDGKRPVEDYIAALDAYNDASNKASKTALPLIAIGSDLRHMYDDLNIAMSSAVFELEGLNKELDAEIYKVFEQQMKNMADAAHQMGTGFVYVADTARKLGVDLQTDLDKKVEDLAKVLADLRAHLNDNVIGIEDVIRAHIKWLEALVAANRATEEQKKELKELKEIMGEVGAATVKTANTQISMIKLLHQAILQVLKETSGSIAKLIVEGGSFTATWKKVAQDIEEAIVKVIIERGVLALIKVLDTAIAKTGALGKVLGTIFGTGGGGSNVPGGGGVLGTGVGAATSGAGSAGGVAGGFGSAAGAGLSATVGMVTGIISAVTGIIGVFQNAHQETSLNAIEHNTRYSMMFLGERADGGIMMASLKTLERAGYMVSNLDNIKATLWLIRDYTKLMVAGGGGGGGLTWNGDLYITGGGGASQTAAEVMEALRSMSRKFQTS